MNQQDKQLLLKDLCARLPYRPISVWIHTVNGIETHQQCEVTLSDVKWLQDQEDFKLVLFPLSALTKEITIAGETFVPIKRLMKSGIISHLDWISNEREYWIKTRGFDNWLGEIPFKTIRHLIEWHFDINGLIDLQLAISVYSLDKNPYE